MSAGPSEPNQDESVDDDGGYPKLHSSTADDMQSYPESYASSAADTQTGVVSSDVVEPEGLEASKTEAKATDSVSAFDGSGAVVELSDAVCVINQFPALAGATLSINEGEVVLVRGPNGAGKSTLLRVCAGLSPLTGGSGKILGHDLAKAKNRRALRREAGLLAHQTYLYDQLTVEENIRFWAKANRVDVSTVDPVLDRLGLGGRLRTVAVGSLSAGQRRRASIALMISRRPRLWLLDEPHAGLDQLGRQLMDELVGHAIAFGATVLMASHDLDRANELATKSVTVVGGRITETNHHVA